MVCYGVPIERGGVIKLQAHAVAWQARKIKRVARSSLAAEAVALSTAIDFAYWLRAVYIEILFGVFDYVKFNNLRPPPMAIPFDYDNGQQAAQPRESSEVFRNQSIVCSKMGSPSKIFCLPLRYLVITRLIFLLK